MILFLVQVYGQYVDDGWQELGIFSTKEKAEQVANEWNATAYGDYIAHVATYTLDQKIEED